MNWNRTKSKSIVKNTDLQLGKIDRYFYILVLLSTPWQITNNPALIFLEINFDEKNIL